jgi:16S rRNA processing protein RimM
MDAVTDDGAMLGQVAAVLNYGAGDIIEIARPGEKETLLIPFTDAAVPTVDLEARRIIVVQPTEITADEANQETE